MGGAITPPLMPLPVPLPTIPAAIRARMVAISRKGKAARRFPYQNLSWRRVVAEEEQVQQVSSGSEEVDVPPQNLSWRRAVAREDPIQQTPMVEAPVWTVTLQPTVKLPELLERVPDSISMLYIFAGKARHSDVASHLQTLCTAGGFLMHAVEVDILRDPLQHDVLDEKNWQDLMLRVTKHEFQVVVVTPPVIPTLVQCGPTPTAPSQ